MKKFNVAVIGCGLIGKRRALCAAKNPGSALLFVVDVDRKAASDTAKKYRCRWDTDWKKAVAHPEVDVVVVSTPHHLLSPISCAALQAGKDVFVEKPMGRNLSDALSIRNAVKKHGKKVKVGFNHRYHPAIEKAHRLFEQGLIGKPLNIRCQYGHGGRSGYEQEWRGNFKLAGGGEMTDQGVHVIDLIQWFCGRPSQVFAILQTAFWNVEPSEDNGFALLKYKSGLVANFHTSWTQWKNLFNFEIFGRDGSLAISGLGGSYGPETLTVGLRKKAGGAPEIKKEVFADADRSWEKEWDDFLSALRRGTILMGNADDGVSVMRTLNSLYQSHRQKRIVAA